jgi:DNA polymerase (family 10)
MVERPPPTSTAVADTLDEVSRLMELAGDNPFKIRAYERGAHAVRHLGDAFDAHLKARTLESVENIGKSLVAAIEELTSTGQLKLLEQLREKIPPGVVELASIPGLGPKKARQVCAELNITTLGELEYAARENRLLHLRGFGDKTQARILAALKARRATTGQCRLDNADVAVAQVRATLGDALTVSPVGQVRRRSELCSGVELLAAAGNVDAAVETALRVLEGARLEQPGVVVFEALPGVRGTLHVVSPEDHAAALVFLTAAPQHLRALEALGTPWRLTARGARTNDGAVSFVDEAAVFAALGLQVVPPELCEDGTSVALARAGALPRLLELPDLRGALHNHTTLSDGRDTARAMQQAATRLGLEYLGISDHSQSAFYARGLKPDVLQAQREELGAALRDGGAVLWHGVESDILQDGGLDYPADVLAQLDFVVASIHSRFQANAEQMTQRLLAAVGNPFTDVLGHPTGRLLLSRDGAAFDVDAVLVAAAQSGCAMELNAQPQRLDLCVEHLRRCKQLGVKVCINADAHSVQELETLAFGVSQARRAGLTREDVINTLGAQEMKAWLRSRRENALARPQAR